LHAAGFLVRDGGEEAGEEAVLVDEHLLLVEVEDEHGVKDGSAAPGGVDHGAGAHVHDVNDVARKFVLGNQRAIFDKTGLLLTFL